MNLPRHWNYGRRRTIGRRRTGRYCNDCKAMAQGSSLCAHQLLRKPSQRNYWKNSKIWFAIGQHSTIRYVDGHYSRAQYERGNVRLYVLHEESPVQAYIRHAHSTEACSTQLSSGPETKEGSACESKARTNITIMLQFFLIFSFFSIYSHRQFQLFFFGHFFIVKILLCNFFHGVPSFICR